MKGKWRILGWLLFIGLLTGCAARPEPMRREVVYPETQAGSADNGCSAILTKIWQGYTESERFTVFGGDTENYVAGEPGDLEMADKTLLQQRFFLSPALMDCITEGAALEHLLNRNVFCTGVFQLKDGTDPIAFSEQMQIELEKVNWQEGSPRRFLIAQPENNVILLAFGQTRVLETFLIRMNQAYPEGRILRYQELLRKNTATETAFGSLRGDVLIEQTNFESNDHFSLHSSQKGTLKCRQSWEQRR